MIKGRMPGLMTKGRTGTVKGLGKRNNNVQMLLVEARRERERKKNNVTGKGNCCPMPPIESKQCRASCVAGRRGFSWECGLFIHHSWRVGRHGHMWVLEGYGGGGACSEFFSGHFSFLPEKIGSGSSYKDGDRS